MAPATPGGGCSGPTSTASSTASPSPQRWSTGSGLARGSAPSTPRPGSPTATCSPDATRAWRSSSARTSTSGPSGSPSAELIPLPREEGRAEMNDVDIAAWSLPMGAALDALLGDPKGWPHPVRLIGGLIGRSERVLRWLVARAGGTARAERLAGVTLTLVVVGLAGAPAWGLVALGDRLGVFGGLTSRVVLIYWGLAAHSLGAEALRASEAADLATARRELS